MEARSTAMARILGKSTKLKFNRVRFPIGDLTLNYIIMTQEQKQLLLVDLSARLTYGVKAYVKNWSKLDRKYYEGVYTVESIHPSLNNILAYSDKFSVEVIVGYDDYEIKPYLFPLSSMTEEQKIIYGDLCYAVIRSLAWDTQAELNGLVDWLNSQHFDYRGLIEKGLAIDCTNLNIY